MSSSMVAIAIGKIERAHQLYREGRHMEALALYTEALAMAKTKAQKMALHSNRAACYLKLHDFWKAADECTAVLELDRQHAGALMLRAQTLVTLEEYQAALFDVNRLMELNPSSEVYKNLQIRLKSQLSLAPIPESEEEYLFHDDEPAKSEVHCQKISVKFLDDTSKSPKAITQTKMYTRNVETYVDNINQLERIDMVAKAVENVIIDVSSKKEELTSAKESNTMQKRNSDTSADVKNEKSGFYRGMDVQQKNTYESVDLHEKKNGLVVVKEFVEQKMDVGLSREVESKTCDFRMAKEEKKNIASSADAQNMKIELAVKEVNTMQKRDAGQRDDALKEKSESTMREANMVQKIYADKIPSVQYRRNEPALAKEAGIVRKKNGDNSAVAQNRGWEAIARPKGHSGLDYSRWDQVEDDSSEEDDEDEEDQPRYRFRVRTIGVRPVK